MRPPVVLAVLLLLAPTTAAQDDGAVATWFATAGDYVMEGDLAALRHLSPTAGADPHLGFRLEAGTLTVEEETGRGLSAGGAVSMGGTHRGSEHVTNAVVEEAEVLPHRDITVLAIDARVQATGHGATWTPSSRAVVDAVDTVEFPDRDSDASVRHTVQVEGMPSLTVTGHFVVMLWDMDVVVDGDGFHGVYSARTTTEPGTTTYTVQGRPVPGPSNINVTELVLEVRGGTLTLGPGTGPLWLHVVDPVIEMGAVRLDGVSGTLPESLGSVPADDATLTLHGDLRVALERAGDALAWTLHGRIDDARIDGQPLAVVAPLAGGPATRSLLPWMTALLVLGIGGLPLHRLRARRCLEDAELLLAAGHFQAAAEVARPLPWSGVRRQAAALRVQALLNADRGDEARRLVRTATGRSDRILAGLVQATVDDWDGGGP